MEIDGRFAIKGHANLYTLGDIAEVGEAKLGYLTKQ